MLERRKRIEKYPFQIIIQKIGIESQILKVAEKVQKKLLGSITFTRTYVDQPPTEELSVSVLDNQDSTDLSPSIHQTTTVEELSTDSLTVGISGVKVTNQVRKKSTKKTTVITGDPEKDGEIFRMLGLTPTKDPNELS
jgi:hypothetical protein